MIDIIHISTDECVLRRSVKVELVFIYTQQTNVNKRSVSVCPSNSLLLCEKRFALLYATYITALCTGHARSSLRRLKNVFLMQIWILFFMLHACDCIDVHIFSFRSTEECGGNVSRQKYPGCVPKVFTPFWFSICAFAFVQRALCPHSNNMLPLTKNGENLNRMA